MVTGSFFWTWVAGVVAGAILAAGLLHLRWCRARDGQRQEWDRLQAVLEEQLREARLSRQRSQETMDRLRGDLATQQALRAAAEERNRRIPEMEDALARREERIGILQEDNTGLKTRLSESEARARAEGKAWKERLELLDKARETLSDAFRALSAEALEHSSRSFLDLARTLLDKQQEGARGDLALRQQAIADLVLPLKESLLRVDRRIQDLDRSREASQASLTEHIRFLTAAQAQLQGETSKLATALRTPAVRGRWGEMQLQRVVEMAGMLEHCDFLRQESAATENGLLRPDMIVRLPNGRNIVVDAKAPLLSYLEAMETTEESVRAGRIRDHARQIRQHMTSLGAKAYWDQFQPSPEFAVLFLPGEVFFSAALEQDPELIEFGVLRRVIPASPTTLIALLKAVACAWQQEQIAKNAKEISEIGRTLYGRLRTVMTHAAWLGRSLNRTVEAYNQTVGSLEERVSVAARRLSELGAATGKEIDGPERVEKHARTPAITEGEPEGNRENPSDGDR